MQLSRFSKLEKKDRNLYFQLCTSLKGVIGQSKIKQVAFKIFS